MASTSQISPYRYQVPGYAFATKLARQHVRETSEQQTEGIQPDFEPQKRRALHERLETGLTQWHPFLLRCVWSSTDDGVHHNAECGSTGYRTKYGISTNDRVNRLRYRFHNR